MMLALLEFMSVFNITRPGDRGVTGDLVELNLGRIGTHHGGDGGGRLADQLLKFDVAQLVDGDLKTVPREPLLAYRCTVGAQ